MRRYFISIIIVTLISCTKEKVTLADFNESKFFSCYFDNNKSYSINSETVNNKIIFEYLKIKSHLNDSILEGKSIGIYFPRGINEFSLKDSLKCKFTLTKNLNGKIHYGKIKRGKINCKSINYDLWSIEIEIEDIYYKGIISKNSKTAIFFKN